MKKTILEQRIQERAEERFAKDYLRFIEGIMSHPFAKKFKVRIGEEEVPLAVRGRNYGVFSTAQEVTEKRTNYQEVKKEWINNYVKEETDNLLKELSNIKHLLY